jgi:hypothetical protein
LLTSHRETMRPFLGVLALLAGTVAATRTNRTIDDETGDSVTGLSPQYGATSTAVWNYGPTCTGCNVHPNMTQCYEQSWHDATAYVGQTVSVTLNFHGACIMTQHESQPLTDPRRDAGTAIYMYGLLANTAANIVRTTNLTFTLDGAPAGTFFHPADATETIVYNVSLFSKDDIPNGPHTLVATATPGPILSSLIMFDYAIYTFDDSPPSSSSLSSSSTSTTSPSSDPTPTYAATVEKQKHVSGALIGGAAGGVVALVVMLALLFCLCRLRRRNAYAATSTADVDAPLVSPYPVAGRAANPGYGAPNAAAYGTAPMWTSPVSVPVRPAAPYSSGSYGDSGHTHVQPLGVPHPPMDLFGRPSMDVTSATSGLGTTTSATVSSVSASTSPKGPGAVPTSLPEGPRRLPSAPVQSSAVRRHDTLLTRGGTIKTMSEAPPAYAPGWDST